MLPFLSLFKGEIAALSAALIWAIASFVYLKLGRRMSPLILNGTKSVLAILLLVLTLWVLQDNPSALTRQALLLLMLSGAIGIGIGDTAFFGSINNLGARRALLMESLAPPLAALIAFFFLQETLNAIAWVGIFLTVGGIAWVVMEQGSATKVRSPHIWRGIGLGLVAAFSQASGAVLSRAALLDSEISTLWSTLIRLLAGVLVILLWLGRQSEELEDLKWLRSPRTFAIVAATAFGSTFLGIWLQQTALKFTAAGVAQSLGATSPLFALPLAVWAGERISYRAVIGVVMALAGIWLLFSRL
ncbi:DMT family transporter [Vacuolonema iberomarrocanum]|uniref:DMT family transporter n=1 Tax=Vacuolonema iberomarrocanum TaxID=3454632 RepID=UPI0019F2AEFA|nr:DMT family transporter [filamentous cyanobacterium LEGE 07170]